MNISVKGLENFKVYRYGEDEPWGVVRDVCFSDDTDRIEALAVDTCSLIPLRRTVLYDSVDHIKGKAVYLKENSSDFAADAGGTNRRFWKNSKIKIEAVDGRTQEILRDFRADAETGEITDIVVSKNKITKKNKIPINKIYIKDNTIYIKKQGGIENE